MSTAVAQRLGRGRGRWRPQHSIAWPLFVAPVAAYLIVSQIYPLIDTIRLSFYRDRAAGRRPPTFTGLENYRYLLGEDGNFWPIVLNSFVWVIGATVLQLIAGVGCAYVLNRRIRMRGLLRGLFLTPWITPIVVAVIAWRWIFDGQFGLLNHYLGSAGITNGQTQWLADSWLVWPSLLVTSMWKGTAYVALMVLAGLQTLPRDVNEAAEVDGAGAWRRFIHIHLPLLKPVLYVTSLIAIVSTWFKFDLIWALTHGGPGYRTSILPTYVFHLAFESFNFGRAAAVATLAMALVIGLVSIFAIVFGRSNVD